MGRNIALILAFALTLLAPTMVMAAAAFASINALGRNPSAAPKILTAMTITLVFAEALGIIALLVIWQLFAA
ncbi:MAG: hypothetical protein JW937_07375 [Candidatus Omnitrophica bacterium]|nr:hypothetical protein [Candidatus Omnitrophota bacterium]